MRTLVAFRALSIVTARVPAVTSDLVERSAFEDALWPCLLSIANDLHNLAGPRRQGHEQDQATWPSAGPSGDEGVAGKPPPTRPSVANTPPTTPPRHTSPKKRVSVAATLPTELLGSIFAFMGDSNAQRDLMSCLRVSRNWHVASVIALYRTPRLSSIAAIDKFLGIVEQSKRDNSGLLWRYHSMTRRLIFTSTRLRGGGSLASSMDFPKGCDEIRTSHSCLFRLMVGDRHSGSAIGWSAAHPVVLRLVSACGMLDRLAEETGPRKGGAKRPESRPRRDAAATDAGIELDADEDAEDGEESEGPIPSPQFLSNPGGSSSSGASRAAQLLAAGTAGLLQNIVRASRQILRISTECNVAPSTLLPATLLLLSLLDRPYSPLWDEICVVAELREMARMKCRRILSAISTVVLTEVQFITASAQRLLNSYCMIYYRALAQANALNLSMVLKSLREAADAEEKTGNLIPETVAGRILQSLRLIFHTPLPTVRDGDHNTDAEPDTSPISPSPKLPPLAILESRTTLREALLSFSPSTLNPETADLISQLLDRGGEGLEGMSGADDVDVDAFLEAVEMAKCLRWLGEVVRWQRAGRQMEPVKELLRVSMGRIERLRSVQRRLGITFME
ncbi:hypothetical protein HK101_007951 [Irineochytrium annulatum]|nr:hypothetical protein HK101_007951 [Irineochytrium annulatum]